MTASDLILVTGATGFVGRRLVDRLVADRRRVRRALRSTAPAIDRVEDVVMGSIEEVADWGEALEGVTAVAHLAARVHMTKGDEGEFERVNHLATARLAEACAASGVRRLVYLSSVKAALDRTGREPVAETSPALPLTAYGRSKLAAERALGMIAGRNGLGVTVLRPPLVYGAGAAGNFAALLRLAKSPFPLPFAGIDNRRSLIALDNLVDAIVLCLGHDVPFGPYFVTDGQPMSTSEIVSALRRATGRSPGMFRVPEFLLRLVAALGQGERIDRLRGSLVIDDRAFRAVTGWWPPVEAGQALQSAITENG